MLILEPPARIINDLSIPVRALCQPASKWAEDVLRYLAILKLERELIVPDVGDVTRDCVLSQGSSCHKWPPGQISFNKNSLDCAAVTCVSCQENEEAPCRLHILEG